MCPHGYHHSGSMATPALGTRDVHLHIYVCLSYIRLTNPTVVRCHPDSNSRPSDQVPIITKQWRPVLSQLGHHPNPKKVGSMAQLYWVELSLTSHYTQIWSYRVLLPPTSTAAAAHTLNCLNCLNCVIYAHIETVKYIYIIQFICILESQVVECSMGSFYTQRF